jgi:hypothetical protein
MIIATYARLTPAGRFWIGYFMLLSIAVWWIV